MTPRRLVISVIAASGVLRLAMAYALGAGNDEAYYAQLVMHPDWSYFDHPPMLAMVGSVGTVLAGGMSAFAMRLGFVAIFAGSSWLMFRLTSRFYGETAGAIAAIVLNATAYYGLASGTFLLPDGPLLFFSLLTLDGLAAAVDRPANLGRWAAVGLAWGGAMLSKYSAVFLAVGALGFLVTERNHRRILAHVGPYLAVGIGLALFAPVVIWNATHQWISFAFQGGRAVGSEFRPMALLGAIGGQAAYLSPWIWAFLIVAMARALRRREASDQFLLWQAIPPLAAFLIVASRREILPHWSLIGLIPIFPMLGREWKSLRSTPRRLAIVSSANVILAVLLVSQARWGWIPMKADPTADSAGWGELVDEIRHRGLLDDPDTFVFTSNWYDSGQLAFASNNTVPVLCYAPRGGHNFDLWADPDRSVGRSGILVVVDPCSTEPAMYDRWFSRIEPAGDVTMARGDRPVRRVRLYRCINQFQPFLADSARQTHRVARSSGKGDSLVR